MIHQDQRTLPFSIKVLLFLVFSAPLIAIVSYHNNPDEYQFAIMLDQCYETFFSFHLLNIVLANIVWFLVTLLGITVSALRALQITSSLLSAMGAVALVDLGYFWGLTFRQSIIFSAPIFLSNAFVRYGTSAYPSSGAMAISLIAVNLLIRHMDAQRNSSKLETSYLAKAGFWCGFAGLMHVIALLLLPGYLLGVFLNLKSKFIRFQEICKGIFFFLLGVLAPLIIGFYFIKILLVVSPILVLATPESMGLVNGKTPAYFPQLSGWITNFKTYMALFTPGIHMRNHLFNLLLNLPRLLVTGILLFLGITAWKKRNSMKDISIWFIPFTVSVISIFLVMVLTNFSFCRQHATISLAIFGPLFLSIGIVSLRNGKKLYTMPMLLVAIIFAIHMIWGIEGVVAITRPNIGIKLRNEYRYFEVRTPKPAHFFWDKKQCTFSYEPRNKPQGLPKDR